MTVDSANPKKLLVLILISLWLVLYFYSRMGLSSSNAPAGIHCKVYGKSLEDLCEALCGAHGFTWTYQMVFGVSQLPGAHHVKSTKVLPVMVMGAFILGLRRKYPIHEYFSSIRLVAGLILFTLAYAHMSPNFSVIGVIMVSGALVMDAFVGKFQEAIFNVNPKTTQTEMLFFSTAISLPLLIPPMILIGELFIALRSCAQEEADGSNMYNDFQPGSLNTTEQLIKDLENIDLVFNIGYLSYANGYISQWDQFTSMVEPIVSRIPCMIASGNHERDWPGSGYSTDYDTEHDWREGTKQYRFLEHCLAFVDRQKQPWEQETCVILQALRDENLNDPHDRIEIAQSHAFYRHSLLGEP